MSNFAAIGRTLDVVEKSVRVMLVDDSAVVRGLISRWVDSEDNLKVVSRCHNGVHAVSEAKTVKPNVIVLDIEMPEMDGLEALPLLLEAAPDARIIIASSLTQRNAEISLSALSKGAHDYVPKPTSNSGLTTSVEFRASLITKINALSLGSGGKPGFNFDRTHTDAAATRSASVSGAKVAGHVTSLAPKESRHPAPNINSVNSVSATGDVGSGGDILRKFNRFRPEVLCVGSSTGGPRAVQTVFAEIAPHISRIPVVLTQHMPETFTAVFADHMAKVLPVPVCEARDGDIIKPGHIYVARGGYHLKFKREGGEIHVVLDDGPDVNFCKPAVDTMFQSALKVMGNKILGVILTGMGQDGVDGGKAIADAGGNILVQDEASSIVWGMPGAAYRAGVAAGIYPLAEIGKKITKVLQEGSL